MRVLLPEVVRARAELLGPAGSAWIAGLEGQVAELAGRWDLTLVGQLPGGTAAVVLRARDGAGRDVVLKVAVPDGDLVDEAGTLERAGGRGYARLLAADLERHAVLLEALGPSLDRSAKSVEEQLRILCDVLLDAWSVRPGDGQQPLDKAGQLHGLVSRLWRETGRPCPRAVFERALACAEARAADPPTRWVVVHGDAAPPNCLRLPAARAGAGSGYAFVDPDGFLGDPAYDLGVALRNWSAQLSRTDPVAAMRRWVGLVAGWTGQDPTAIGQWALLERVSTGLFLLSLGERDLGRGFLGTAEVLAGSW